MFATNVAIDPLRRRMIEDMSVRKLAAKTQHDDMQRVKDFAGFLGPSPDTAKSGGGCVAFGCIWRRAAPARQRSTTASCALD
jgi:hypothetical protein